jgi:hypothetical protein
LGQENLEPCSVSTVQLCDLAVTSEKLAKCSVTSLELCDNAVTNPKIADNAVGSAELIDGAAIEAKIANEAVATSKLKNSAVTSDKLNTNSVTEPKLAGNAVSTSKLQNNAVTSAKIADGEVKNAELSVDAVTQSKIATGAVGHFEHHQTPAAYVDIVAPINVANGVEWTIFWQGTQWDNGWDFWGQAMFDGTGGLRAPIAGLYLFEAGVMIQNVGSGGGTRMKLIRNHEAVASTTPSAIVDASGNPFRSRMSASTVLWMNAGDVCWTNVFQNSGGVLPINPDNRVTHQSMTWIAAPPTGY